MYEIVFILHLLMPLHQVAWALGDTKYTSGLRELDLGYNYMGCDGIGALVPALKHNATLQILRLHFNEIACAGATALASALQTKALQLHTLDLKTNGIGDPGCVALASALKRNTSLTILDLECNKVRCYWLLWIW